jgi:rfaE bifunctional protein nucleotidyltransferase chain/domain
MNITLISGSFDVLHAGHVQILNFAKSLGDLLFVAVDSDERIAQKKGPQRPFNSLKDRIYLLKNLKMIDEIYSFSDDEGLISIIKRIKPENLVVGSDWRGKPIIGQEFARNTIYFERVGNHSTTRILNSSSDTDKT